MYVIAKEDANVRSVYGAIIELNLSKIWKVVRTPACKAGEYALFLKDEIDTSSKFSIFQGYITYSNVCDWFEMIKYKKEKSDAR